MSEDVCLCGHVWKEHNNLVRPFTCKLCTKCKAWEPKHEAPARPPAKAGKPHAQYPFLYHGTPKSKLKSVLKLGLRPDYSDSHNEWPMGVYLTDDPTVAQGYAGHNGFPVSDWVVLQIATGFLDMNEMVPDDYDFPDVWDRMDDEEKATYADSDENWAHCPWYVSMAACSQAAYLATIPPEAIKVYTPGKTATEIDPLTAERDAKFDELASAQRGLPESAMLRCQHHPLGAGVGPHTLEHVGDITNRMAQRFSFLQGQYGIVMDKVEKCLRWLTNGYGFERELLGNMQNNYNAYVEDKNPKVAGRTFEELKADFFSKWDAYAAAHAELTVYNDAQRFARDAAIALGRRQFARTIENLEALKQILDEGVPAYIEAAGQYTPGKTATQLPPKGLTFEKFYDWHELGDPELDQNQLYVLAYLDGKHVGSANFILKSDYLYPNDVQVEPEYRRKGIASAMYIFAEEETELKLRPHSIQTPEGQALWHQNRDRKFGSTPVRKTANNLPTFEQIFGNHRPYDIIGGGEDDWQPYDEPALALAKQQGIDLDGMEQEEKDQWIFDNVARGMLQERFNKLRQFFGTMTFPLTVYRAIDLQDLNDLRTEPKPDKKPNNRLVPWSKEAFGHSWAWDEKGAQPYGSNIDFNINDFTFMFRGVVQSSSDVDWETTLEVNFLLPEEHEIRVQDGRQIQITGYKKAKNGGEWLQPEERFKTVVASHKTTPLSDTTFPNMDSNDGQGSNAYALIPEKVEGMNNEPKLDTLLGGKPAGNVSVPSLKAAATQTLPVARHFTPLPFEEFLKKERFWDEAMRLPEEDLEYREDEYLTNITHYGNLDFPLTVYRALEVPEGKPIDFDKTGIYWTWAENSADAYFGGSSIWGKGGEKGELVFIKAEILSPNDVDWEGTMRANFIDPEENEIRLKPGVELKLLGVDDGSRDGQGNGYKPVPGRAMVTAAANKPNPLTQTPEFKAWFGDSEVVDKQGNPKVMYHGTSGDFEKFDTEGRLIFFTEDPKFASLYAGYGTWDDKKKKISPHKKTKPLGAGSNVMPVYLKCEKLFDYRNSYEAEEVAYDVFNQLDEYDFNRACADYYEVLEEELTEQQTAAYDASCFAKQVKAGSWVALELGGFIWFLQRYNYDGIVMTELGAINIAVFNSNQVKSAIGNAGEFDGEDGRITASVKKSYGVVMVEMPEGITDTFEIDEDDLDGSGREDEPHITVRYGIEADDDLEAIKDVLSKAEPFTVTLGKTGSFPPSKSSDGASVVIVHVDSPDLHKLNEALGKVGKWKKADFDYKAHMTVAYVKEGTESKYVDLDTLVGIEHKVSELVISDANEVHHVVQLGGIEKAKTAISQFYTQYNDLYKILLRSWDYVTKSQFYSVPVVSLGKMGGYEVRKAEDETHTYFVLYDGVNDKIAGITDFSQVDKYFTVDAIAFLPEYKGQGLAAKWYAWLIKNKHCPILVSGERQSVGGRAIWEQLAKMEDIFVYAWNQQTNEMFTVDPDDLSAEEPIWANDTDEDYDLLRKELVEGVTPERHEEILSELEGLNTDKEHVSFNTVLVAIKGNKPEMKRQAGATISGVWALPRNFDAFVKTQGGFDKLFSSIADNSSDWDRYEPHGKFEQEEFESLTEEEQKQWIWDRAYADWGERYYDIISTHESWNWPLRVWRVVTLNSLRALKTKGIGIYWAYEEDAAEAHWGSFGDGSSEYTIEAQITEDAVDWESTILANLSPATGEDEKEITLNPGAPVKILRWKGEDNVWKNALPEWKQVTAYAGDRNKYIPRTNTETPGLHTDPLFPEEDDELMQKVAVWWNERPIEERVAITKDWAERNKLLIQDGRVRLYHGTTEETAQIIEKQGLSKDANLIGDPKEALWYARSVPRRGRKFVVFECWLPLDSFHGSVWAVTDRKLSPEEISLKRVYPKGKTAYFNNDMVWLKNYLTMSDRDKGEELSYKFTPSFVGYVEENYPEVWETIKDRVEDGYLDSPEGIPDEVFTDFYQNGSDEFMNMDPAECPSFMHMSYEGMVKNQWLLHKTDNPDSICQSGFTYGMGDLSRLGLTTWFNNDGMDKQEGGYNFAFLAQDSKAMRYAEDRYGREAVIFRASGVKVYHYGDEETQVIFRGSEAHDIIPVVKDGNTGMWALPDDDHGKPVFQADYLQQIVQWVMNHYAQYRKVIVKRASF
jgi:2'-5' RNA ligase/GNAT superfamily N-acetyltransferase